MDSLGTCQNCLLLLLLHALVSLVSWSCLTDSHRSSGQQEGDSSHVCLSAELTGLIYSSAALRYLEGGWKPALTLHSGLRGVWTLLFLSSDHGHCDLTWVRPRIPSLVLSRRGPFLIAETPMCVYELLFLRLVGMWDWPDSEPQSEPHEEVANVQSSSGGVMSWSPETPCASLGNQNMGCTWKYRILVLIIEKACSCACSCAKK